MSTPFTVGQRVTFSMLKTSSAGSYMWMRWRSVKGKIASIDGESAMVARRGAKPMAVRLCDLTDTEEHNQKMRDILKALRDGTPLGGQRDEH